MSEADIRTRLAAAGYDPDTVHHVLNAGGYVITRAPRADDDVVVLELRCCCCGKLMDTLTTLWPLATVRPEVIFTRQPCGPCEVQLAAEELERKGR